MAVVTSSLPDNLTTDQVIHLVTKAPSIPHGLLEQAMQQIEELSEQEAQG